MSANRLGPRPGEWIDRTRTVTFRFEGREVSGFAGDTLTSALWCAGIRATGRSFKYHRPRGICSMANHDVNNMFTDGARTNIRADVTPVRDGMNCFAVNTQGGVAKDSGRFVEWLSAFMPVGFYYKAFHKPRMLFPRWERFMREMAGLGAVDPKHPRLRTPKSYSFCDVLVVGAGPSGLSAAIAAREKGARVLLVDESPHAGGTLGYQEAGDPDAARLLAGLLEKVAASGVEMRLGTEAAGYYADHWVALVDEKRMSKARAKSVLFANGACEQPAVFRNNDLPGVMLASGAQRLIYRYRVKPFHRAVVLTANADGYRAAIDLKDAGVDLAAVVDLREEADGSVWARKVRDAKIPIQQHPVAAEAVPAKGKKGIVGIRLRFDASSEIACDGIAVSVGWAPADSLFCQAGGKMAYSDLLEQFVPDRVPPGVFAAGRLNGIYKLEDRLADGRRAGEAAAAHAGVYGGPLSEGPEREGPARSHPFPVFKHPKSREFLDLDEDVQVKDIENAVQEGYDNVELLKRYSTFGMGPSQGKIANTNCIRTLARCLNRTVGETGSPTARPFFHPVPLSHLAGRGFNPHRETAMHAFHEAAGARFLHAGVWLRPAYYGKSREESIEREAQAVRRQAGIIDVSTLGKLEINGPDAGAFIERMYTARFAKMKTGTTRYAVMCDETGVVIDDGVTARMDDDRYYVTCTTTGADGVYREMQRWAILWGLRVTLINVTGATAAMNLAGPQARAILAPLTDVRLEEAAFPYLGFREGAVAGAPARLLRVGFVGELGYEIHVPSQYGRHVWDAILGAGVRPFGVEAQRLLRLEKGHLIVGQDTDGLTHPFEAALDWAVKMDKPFFVGQRSLAILSKKPLKRRLVGFTLPENHRGPSPKECHLVVKDGRITGRVTSVSSSPTLGRVLGLAYVSPDQAAAGSTFTIRIDGGREVLATVVPLPFYDPDNLRQTDGVPKGERQEKLKGAS